MSLSTTLLFSPLRRFLALLLVTFVVVDVEYEAVIRALKVIWKAFKNLQFFEDRNFSKSSCFGVLFPFKLHVCIQIFGI